MEEEGEGKYVGSGFIIEEKADIKCYTGKKWEEAKWTWGRALARCGELRLTLWCLVQPPRRSPLLLVCVCLCVCVGTS